MLPQSPSASQAPRRFGVGIDTSRYGHYAAFLNEQLQPAAAELQFPESAAGYALLRGRLDSLTRRHGPAHFVVRLDAAGQYADNLRHFLHGLASPAAGAVGAARFSLTLSCGDPQRRSGQAEACDERSPPQDVTSAWARRGGVNLQPEVAPQQTERPPRDSPVEDTRGVKPGQK